MIENQREVAGKIISQGLLALKVFELTRERKQFVVVLDQLETYRKEFERGVVMVDEEVVGPEEVVDDNACPSFGIAWDAKAQDCVACSGVYPDEHDECKKLTLQRRVRKEGAGKQGKKIIPLVDQAVAVGVVPEAVIPIEEQDKSKPELQPGESVKKERKKVSRDATGGLTITEYCLKLIKEGKNEQEVKEGLKQVYLSGGKDEKFAKGRANAIFSWALKQAK